MPRPSSEKHHPTTGRKRLRGQEKAKKKTHDAPHEKKRRKWRPGTVAFRQMIKTQKYVHGSVIKRAVTRRMFRHFLSIHAAALGFVDTPRVCKGVDDTLRAAVDDYVVNVFQRAGDMTPLSKRMRVNGATLQLANYFEQRQAEATSRALSRSAMARETYFVKRGGGGGRAKSPGNGKTSKAASFVDTEAEEAPASKKKKKKQAEAAPDDDPEEEEANDDGGAAAASSSSMDIAAADPAMEERAALLPDTAMEEEPAHVEDAPSSPSGPPTTLAVPPSIKKTRKGARKTARYAGSSSAPQDGDDASMTSETTASMIPVQ